MSKEVSILRPGTGVIVRDSNATIIGKGMFMNKENEMYGQVVLQENMSKKKDEINLPKTVGKKVTFQQLRKNDVFQWKISYLAADVFEREGEEDSSSSDEEPLSAMEEKRLASIRHNELAWDEISKGNISMDEKGELFFSRAAEHLRDYEPPVDDDNQGKLRYCHQRKLSQRLVQRNLDHHLKGLQRPCPISKQSPPKKCKILPPAASPKKKGAPSKNNTRGSRSPPKKSSKESPSKKRTSKSPSKQQAQASTPSSHDQEVEKHTKESKYWTYISDSDAESLEPEPASEMGRGKRQRKIKIRSDDDIM